MRIRPGEGADDRSLYGWNLSADRTRLVDMGGADSSAEGASTPSNGFHFNRVFTPDQSTQQLYDDCIRAGIEHFLAGYNGTIFAYGQTASGKTHTMLGTPDTPGLTLLAIDHIFARIAADPSRLYLLRCSYVEVYLEDLNDLLAPAGSGKNKVLREVAGTFKVVDLTESVVTSAKEVHACIERGIASRKVGVSNLNEHSSRSHSIFRLTLESTLKTDLPSANKGSSNGKAKLSGAVQVSELSLVDLAGSETLSYDFGAAQQKETKSINTSLTMLKSVITALSKREAFVPYRNSTLTKLLRNSLGGNAKTTLICTFNPLPVHARISRATLSFGQMAQSITNRAHVNEVSNDDAVMLRQYKKKIDGLEARLSDYSRLEEEKARIQRDYLALQAHLAELQRREAEQRALQSEINEASRVVVGGAEAVAAATAAAALSPQHKGVSDAEMAALSSQLSALQSQKDELEEAKRALEARLLQQQSWQRETEASIRDAQRDLEESNARAEAEQERLRVLEQQLASRQAEDEARQATETQLQAALAEAQRLSNEKLAQSEALARQLEQEKRLSEEKEAASAALAAQLDAARRQSEAKDSQAAALAEQLAEQKRVSEAKDSQAAALAAQLAEQKRASEAKDSQAAALADQLAELKRISASKDSQATALAAQLTEQKRLSDAKDSQAAALAEQLADLKRNSDAKDSQAAALAAQLAEQKRISEEKLAQARALQEQLDAAAADRFAKEAALAQMQAAQQEAALKLARQLELLEASRLAQQEQRAAMERQRAEQERRAAELQEEMERQRIDQERKAAELRSALVSAKEASAQISSAANERWARQMQLLAESGMDKDSYLAALIDDYETKLDKQALELQEAESLRFAQQLDFTEKIEEAKRHVQRAQEEARQAQQQPGRRLSASQVAAQLASQHAGGSGGAPPPVALPAAGSFASPDIPAPKEGFAQPPSAAAASSSSSAANGAQPLQLGLEIPGKISLAEGAALMAQPLVNPSVSPCGQCGSKERLRGEKLRQLTNHAARTLVHYHEQRSALQRQVRDMQATLELYGLDQQPQQPQQQQQRQQRA